MNDRRRKHWLSSIEVYDRITTTMDHPPPSLPGATIAETQTRGRGRTGGWISPPGGVWLTLHLPGTPPPALSIAVGGCLADRLNKLLKGRILGVKWPNDIVAHGSLAKTAGILVETKNNTTRIGIGVNVYNKPPPGAVSLAQLGYQSALAEVAVAAIEAALEAWNNTSSCIAKAAENNALKNCYVVVETYNGYVEGIVRDIDVKMGVLILVTVDGRELRIACCHVVNISCSGKRITSL